MGFFQKWERGRERERGCVGVCVCVCVCNLRGIFWYIVYSNWMLLKSWPNLTFGWPFINISITIHVHTHSKLIYIFFVILTTSRVIWYTRNAIWSIMKFWPHLTSAWPLLWRDQIVKNFVKIFLTYNDFNTISNSFSSKWHLSPFSTTPLIIIGFLKAW